MLRGSLRSRKGSSRGFALVCHLLGAGLTLQNARRLNLIQQIMDATWIGLLVVWAVVELIQFLRKRPFPQRMRTGAYWGVGFAALAALGSASREVNTWKFLAVSLAVYGAGAFVMYGFRVLLAKGWTRLVRPKDAAQT